MMLKIVNINVKYVKHDFSIMITINIGIVTVNLGFGRTLLLNGKLTQSCNEKKNSTAGHDWRERISCMPNTFKI